MRRWYQAAADQGFARSQAKLGALILDAVGGDANLDDGKEWLEKAAAQRDPYARYRLGMLHLEGRGYERKQGKEAAGAGVALDDLLPCQRLRGSGR